MIQHPNYEVGHLDYFVMSDGYEVAVQFEGWTDDNQMQWKILDEGHPQCGQIILTKYVGPIV